jgi:hypothetical protein
MERCRKITPDGAVTLAAMWRRSKEWDPEDVLARQLAMNQQTWTALQAHGVTEETELRLDFTYKATGLDKADELGGFLRVETDYEVRTDDTSVSGTTQATAVSPGVLDQWVTWMVLAGHEHGRCEFDGWGTAVPKKSSP